MPKYRHHKYTWSKPFGNVYHNWAMVGPVGALNFWAHMYPEREISAGIEYHHTALAAYRPCDAPDHTDCPLTGGPCWHDGSSLYAIETVWPMVEDYLRVGDHAMIFRHLEVEADRHFDELVNATRVRAKHGDDA